LSNLHSDWSELGGEAPDPETTLILDYLSNQLTPAEASRLEERATLDGDFRRKLADVVLLKGLLLLALERDGEGPRSECRDARKSFGAYVRGTITGPATASMSRHLEHCVACDVEFEHFRDSAEKRRHTSRLQRAWSWVTGRRRRA
jgi:anti-sigma factor RsiW